MTPSPVDAPNRASKASRYAKPVHIQRRTYTTLEGALGAAYRLSRLERWAECHVWKLNGGDRGLELAVRLATEIVDGARVVAKVSALHKSDAPA